VAKLLYNNNKVSFKADTRVRYKTMIKFSSSLTIAIPYFIKLVVAEKGWENVMWVVGTWDDLPLGDYRWR